MLDISRYFIQGHFSTMNAIEIIFDGRKITRAIIWRNNLGKEPLLVWIGNARFSRWGIVSISWMDSINLKWKRGHEIP